MAQGLRALTAAFSESWVQLSAPPGNSQLSITPVSGDQMLLSGLGGH